jgi:hypothetical protein
MLLLPSLLPLLPAAAQRHIVGQVSVPHSQASPVMGHHSRGSDLPPALCLWHMPVSVCLRPHLPLNHPKPCPASYRAASISLEICRVRLHWRML